MLFDAPLGMAFFLLEGTKKKILIDASSIAEAERFAVKLKDTQLRPDFLILTHPHFDHAAGALQFKKSFPDIKVMASYSAIDSLKHNSEFNEAFNEVISNLEPIDDITPLKEGDIIDLGELQVQIIETPGHTKCSISLFDLKNKMIFVGDSLGYMWTRDLIMPPIMPPEFSEEKLFTTFDKIKKLNYSSIGLAHFGFLTKRIARTFPEKARSCYLFWKDFFVSEWTNHKNEEKVVKNFIKKLG